MIDQTLSISITLTCFLITLVTLVLIPTAKRLIALYCKNCFLL